LNRTSRFFRSLLSGYGTSCVVAACSLVSVSIAFRHFSATEFGLWALVFQINSYLLLADFGVSNAVGRFLMDWKDQRPSRSFGAIFIAGFFLCLVQAGFVIVLALLVACWGPDIFRISPGLQGDFRFLIITQAMISCLLMPFRVFTFALVAYGRFDWINLGGMLGQVFSLAGFAWGIQQGWGIRSYLVGTTLETVLAASVLWAANHRLGLAPKKTEWSRPSLEIFQKILKYGRDMFMVLIGGRLVYGSQALLLARFASLEQVAIWSVGSKMFVFLRELSAQVGQASGPLLIELYQQGDSRKAVSMMQHLVSAGSGLAAIFGSILIFWNGAFVQAWTHGKIKWDSELDFFLALLLLLLGCLPVLIHVTGMTKNLEKFRWASLSEGSLFIVLASPAIFGFGIIGMVLCQLLSALLIGWFFVSLVLGDFNRAHGTHVHFPLGVLLVWTTPLLLAFVLKSLILAEFAAGLTVGSTCFVWMVVFLLFIPSLLKFQAQILKHLGSFRSFLYLKSLSSRFFSKLKDL